MENDQFDPVRHANAPKNALVRVNEYNEDHWEKISRAGWSPVRGLSNGEWVMRRDFPQGFVSPEDMPKYFEQCLKLMGGIWDDFCQRCPPYSDPPVW